MMMMCVYIYMAPSGQIIHCLYTFSTSGSWSFNRKMGKERSHVAVLIFICSLLIASGTNGATNSDQLIYGTELESPPQKYRGELPPNQSRPKISPRPSKLNDPRIT
ncbi:hypothetical protein M8C21_006690 [Ambrosia artemisiifolia]|uniref:Uncharacterized protein n=1 Tax=Ambrosia artemisiifolia TaxID=4212 RepID=A0AAD5CNP7_AMBAR|nr:hypothetical protein M8C21_006690 [Ambrosia artemisiifolia]